MMWSWIVKYFKPKAMITADQLNMICTTISHARSEELATLINESCAKYGITSKDVLHELLANIIQESGEMQHKEENMYYRPETLMKVWPARFPTLKSTEGYARNPQALANKVYGGRMGNKEPNDGWEYRGGGYVGLTGREVYGKYAMHSGLPSIEDTARAVRTEDKYAMDSAFWFVCVLKDLEDEAERDDFIGIVKSINGGKVGLKTREHYYALCKKYI